MPDFHQILCMLPMAVVRSSSSGVAICHVVPVLRMTSYFNVMAIRRMPVDIVATSDVIAARRLCPIMHYGLPANAGCIALLPLKMTIFDFTR